MKGDSIPSQHHVARHCRYNDLVWKDGDPIAVTESAFIPRSGENDGLSVIWVDFFQGNGPHRLSCVRSVTKLQARNTHRIAYLQVQDIIQAVSPSNLGVEEDPDEGLPPQHNASHALIRPIHIMNDIIVRQKLATRIKPSDLYKYK